jgi:hypothetical protein
MESSVDAASDATIEASLDATIDAAMDTALDAPIDSSDDSLIDTSNDSLIDSSDDLSTDVSLDSPIDASLDSPIDASLDSAPDVSLDAPIDASLDSPIDASLDAPIDAPPDVVIVVGDSVVQRNKNPSRDGLFIQPSLTKAAAATLARDSSFTATYSGMVYASPLYAQDGPGGHGAFVVATESNDVFAFDETTGATLWSANLGQGAQSAIPGQPNCSNIVPLGVTGTPYIDLASRTVYVSSALGTAATPSTIRTHAVHALSLDDGHERAGWPVDLSTLTASNTGVAFVPYLQNQRGSLIVVGGTLYVPFGGHSNDCGSYHGWLVAIPTANPAGVTAWATPVVGGGMWGPGGPSSDGTNVFASTGNTFGATTWSGGEAVIRFGAGATFSGSTLDYFAPSNWKTVLDPQDKDMGGSGPVLVDVPGATPSAIVVAMSKYGVMHLLDRANLGGVGTGNGTTGEGVASDLVASDEIINAAAAYRTATSTYVVFHIYNPSSSGAHCPAGTTGDLVAVAISATSPPTLRTAWCADNFGQGSPIVTTTDGTSDAIVWTAGAEGSNRLHGFDGDTGRLVYSGGGSGDVMSTLHRFTSPIAVHGRIVVAGDNHLYAFKP